MQKITDKAYHYYSNHGWSDADIEYIKENATIIESEKWVMAVGLASDGVVWLYPVSSNDVFPVSLWKEIRNIILTVPNVVIPMQRNMGLVANAAKRYNGYLNDNLFMFGDELKGVQFPKEGARRCHN